MRIKSYSKINLSLRVINKLKNGMHNIETNSVLINLFDEIDININKKDIILFKGRFKNKINLKNNTIKDTLALLRKFNIIKKNYKIIIKKNIPAYAGLGGGTSNSASIVRYFLKNKLNAKLIKAFEQKIGSDFKLFLNNSSFQKNLRQVFKTQNNINYPLLIVFPNIDCKTKNVYQLVKNFSPQSGSFYLKRLHKNKFINAIKEDQNDLQKIAERKFLKIFQLIKLIKKQEGCIFSRMTGSGSACYGVFKSKKTAKFAMTKLKRKCPKYWCVVTKTI